MVFLLKYPSVVFQVWYAGKNMFAPGTKPARCSIGNGKSRPI